MHPDLAELLTLREERDRQGPVALHVAGCTVCRSELERLQRLRAALQSAPGERGPDHWPQVAARLDSPAAAAHWPRPGWRLAGGLAAVLAIAVGVALLNRPTPQASGASPVAGINAPSPAAGARESVAALMAESKRLESVLARIPGEPRVVRAATVMTAAGLEDRIEWIDLALGADSTSSLNSGNVAPLWRQRVDLLNSLVAVRYAQVRTASY
jgi:hypothetical protein